MLNRIQKTTHTFHNREAPLTYFPDYSPADGSDYKASRKDQKIILGTLTDIAQKVKAERITMTAIVIIGDVIKPKSYEYSKLYDKNFSHGFRQAKK